MELESQFSHELVTLTAYSLATLCTTRYLQSSGVGCMVVEQDGPMESDWLCVCLKRKGEYYWVRHIDLSHGHAGEDDGQQEPDSDGDGEIPVEEQTVWDYVFPTTHEEYEKKSIHGTDPRPNPFGGDANWQGGA